MQRELQHMLRDNDGHVSTGVVSAVEQHDSWGWLATVALQPSQREVQARVLGWGPVYVPVAVGAEVAIFFPDSDTNAAILLPGLPSEAAPVPSDWDNASVRVEAGDQPVEIAAGTDTRALITVAPDGSVTVSAPGGIKLQGSGTAADFVALASLVKAELDALRAELLLHTHMVPVVGMSATPTGIGATSNAVACTSTKAE